MRKYEVTKDFDMLDSLFIKGMQLHISESKYVMNGRIDYGRDIYVNNRRIGMIRDSLFYDKVKYCVCIVEENKLTDKQKLDKAILVLKQIIPNIHGSHRIIVEDFLKNIDN